jgi:methyl-accepting chemotaxis protein
MFGLWQHLNLKVKIIFLFTFLIFFILTVYVYFSITAQRSEELMHFDTELSLAAHSYTDLVSDEMIDLAINDKLSKEEYDEKLLELRPHTANLRLEFLYCMTVVDSKVKYVIDGMPMDDEEMYDFSYPMTDYEDASPKVLTVWDSWKPMVDEYQDTYGYFRAYFLPYQTKSGNKIIISAETSVHAVNEKLQRALRQQIIMASIIMLVSFGITFLFANTTVNAVELVVSHVIHLKETRDFTKTIALKSKDEIGKMAESLNALQDALRQAIGEASDVSAENALHAQEFSSAADSIHNSVSSSSKQVGKLTEQANQILNEAQHSAKCAADVRSDIDKTNLQLTDASVALKELAMGVNETVESSRALAKDLQDLNFEINSIGKVLEAVSEISDQTDMLAINASIEAAHAGKVGKGFAIVANEVRSLATRTQQTVGESNEIVKNITQEINRSVARIGSMVEINEKLTQASNKSLQDMESIYNLFQETISIVNESAESSDNIKTSISYVTEHLKDVSSDLDSSQSHADEILNVANSMVNKSEHLKKQLSSFKVKKDFTATRF